MQNATERIFLRASERVFLLKSINVIKYVSQIENRI